VRVVVLERRPLVASALRRLLDGGGVAVVATTAEPALLPELAATAAADAVLVDLDVPADDLAEALATVRRRARVALVACGDGANLELVATARAAGAAAFVDTTGTPAEVAAALRAALSGGPVERRRRSRGGALTAGEERLLAALARGAATAELADELGVAPATVKTHLSRLYRKLGVTNRTAAARRAVAREVGGPGDVPPPR
jgi:DNA-binding NarL/FixJ family response regulator